MTRHYLAVDIGGSKVDICRIDQDFGVLTAERFSTVALGKGSMTFMDRLKPLLEERVGEDTVGLGVSFNCSLNDGVCVWSSVLGGEVGYPIEEDLESVLGLPVSADDDIHAMTVAEATVGSGVGSTSFAMLTIGTGIGVGCHDRRLLRGARNNAGLIGQRPTYVPDLDEVRHLDRVVSGRGMSEIYGLFGGQSLAAKEVFDRVGRDPIADRTLGVFTRHLADIIVDINQFYDPELIVLCGSVRHAAPLYLDAAWERFRSLVEPAFQTRRIVVSELEYAAPIGAAIQLARAYEGEVAVAQARA